MTSLLPRIYQSECRRRRGKVRMSTPHLVAPGQIKPAVQSINRWIRRGGIENRLRLRGARWRSSALATSKPFLGEQFRVPLKPAAYVLLERFCLQAAGTD